mgnify:CR=1 FL=1
MRSSPCWTGTIRDTLRRAQRLTAPERIAAIVLAAGEARRFGSDKLLYNLTAQLFKTNDAVRIIKYKEIYEFLEFATDSCEDVADVLQDMKLVDDLGTLWKRWSTRIAASQAVLVAFWLGLPDDWKTAIPGWALSIVVGVFALAVIGAQSVKQPGLKPPSDGAQ